MNEKEFDFAGMKLNGFAMLFVNLALTAVSIALIIWGINGGMIGYAVAGILALILTFFLWPGFFMLEPNEAVVMLFFGKSESDYREIVINKLCQKKQYDFCEVSTYKLKTEALK